MDALVKDIDEVLKDFILGKAIAVDYAQYNALEQIAVIISKHRRPAAVKVQSYDLDD